ncbi:MAG: beta-glucosidase [Ktedonobacterales bacterium]|nr:beta-glucosidase [Ktedonobacterales bacterium]
MQDTPFDPAFPADFLWGASTSAYQIEGAVHEDGRGASIWDQFAATPGKTFAGESGEVACDHYHRMPEDVELMASMNMGAYRFSVAWPRVQPDGSGPVNAKGLDFYDRLVDALLAHHITPVLTLHHWDLPLALYERGGWLNRETAACFADYAEIVARRLGDRVPWWLTINEPWCAAFLGYGNGLHAPGKQDMPSAFTAGHHLLLAHGMAMQRLRSILPQGAQLGIALNLNPSYAHDNSPETLRAVQEVDRFNNSWFLDPIFRGSYPEQLFADFHTNPPPIEDGDMAVIMTPLDYLGVNYYSRALIPLHQGTSPVGTSSATVVSDQNGNFTEMGWEIYPPGLTDLMMQLHRDYHSPKIVITENGAAFADVWDGGDTVDDPRRTEYLQAHIRALAAAQAQGVPVGGYLAWSLMDNFEWAEGYSKRFGLVYVDFPTQRRIVKASGLWYAAFMRQQRTRE